jgi:glycosyltransferase involved in cell wall biosynthesis
VLNGKKILVVLPAFEAEKTLEKTMAAIPMDVVDDVLLVDDDSSDQTIEIAHRLGIRTYKHPTNRGYGGNQKTCYTRGLETDADIFVMLHPDYQYEPKLIPAMAAMLACGTYDAVIASRILGNDALAAGMPLYKYIANRVLTALQNILIGSKMSEFHTGYRAFTREVLEKLPLEANSDDFIFDNQMLTQLVALDFQIGEISCPTKYFPEASSINLKRSIRYGLGVVHTSLLFRLWRWGILSPAIFQDSPAHRLRPDSKR